MKLLLDAAAVLCGFCSVWFTSTIIEQPNMVGLACVGLGLIMAGMATMFAKSSRRL